MSTCVGVSLRVIWLSRSSSLHLPVLTQNGRLPILRSILFRLYALQSFATATNGELSPRAIYWWAILRQIVLNICTICYIVFKYTLCPNKNRTPAGNIINNCVKQARVKKNKCTILFTNFKKIRKLLREVMQHNNLYLLNVSVLKRTCKQLYA